MRQWHYSPSDGKWRLVDDKHRMVAVLDPFCASLVYQGETIDGICDLSMACQWISVEEGGDYLTQERQW